MLHDILEDNHIQWHSPLMRDYTNFWPFTDLDLITEFDFLPIRVRFPKNICNGYGKQRTLTPPDTCSCPTFGLECILMSGQISSELVLFPDYWVLNIPRYFSFALLVYYTIHFGFSLIWDFLRITFQFFNYFFRYESTEVDHRTWLHVPSGTLWSTSNDTHQVVEI